MSDETPSGTRDVLEDIITFVAAHIDPRLSDTTQAEGVVVLLVGALARASRQTQFDFQQLADMVYFAAVSSMAKEREADDLADP